MADVNHIISHRRPSSFYLGARVRMAAGSLARWPLVLVPILIGLVLLPNELSFYVGEMRFTPYRLCLLAYAPWVFAQLLGGDKLRLALPDGLFLAATAWIVVSLFINQGFAEGAQSGGIAVLETIVPYFLARLAVTNSEQFVSVVKFLLVLTIPLALIGVTEGLLHVSVVHQLMKALTGNTVVLVPMVRLGIFRASGTFDHPIHYGVWMMMMFSPVYLLVKQKAIKVPFAYLWPLIGVFFSLSSGPWVGVVLQVALIVYERVTRRIEHRWFYLIGALGLLYVLVDLASNRGAVKVFLSYAALQESSAYYRTLIFDLGMQNVYAHPLWGLGFHEWTHLTWMGDSVDNYWLLTAMRYGIPALLAYVAGIIALLTAVNRRQASPMQPDLAAACRHAWNFSVIALLFVGASVDYWHSIEVIVWMFWGLGGWMILPRKSPSVATPALARRLRTAVWLPHTTKSRRAAASASMHSNFTSER